MPTLEHDLNQLRIDPRDKASGHPPARRWPWAVGVVLLLIVIVGWRFRGSGPPVVQTFHVAAPADADAVVLNATGYVVAAHKIELASKVIGRVAWVGVEMGDRIEKANVLVRLEDDEYRARVDQEQGLLDSALAKLDELKAGSRPQETATVQAKLDQSLAELTVAQTNMKRLADLEATKAVSRQQIDDANALTASRKAQVDSDRQQLELSRLGPRKEQVAAQEGTVRQLRGGLALAMVDLDNTVIRAPMSATVLERNVEVGEFVTNGFVGDRGAKGYVLSIADLDDLRVDLDVSQNDFAKVLPKQLCWITTDAYPDRRYAGSVDLISPEANRQKATVQVRVKVGHPDDRLRPDMNATVSFLNPGATTKESTTRPTIRVPATAMRDSAVFVVEEGKAVKRTVTGQTSGDGFDVRTGLKGGETVIADPPAGLQDGDPVLAKE